MAMIAVLGWCAGCGTFVTRTGQTTVGAYPYQAVYVDFTLFWPDVFRDDNWEVNAVNTTTIIVSTPIDICLDTIGLPFDLVAWGCGYNKDGFKLSK
jgi:uncharacterized protein YceK